MPVFRHLSTSNTSRVHYNNTINAENALCYILYVYCVHCIKENITEKILVKLTFWGSEITDLDNKPI